MFDEIARGSQIVKEILEYESIFVHGFREENTRSACGPAEQGSVLHFAAQKPPLRGCSVDAGVNDEAVNVEKSRAGQSLIVVATGASFPAEFTISLFLQLRAASSTCGRRGKLRENIQSNNNRFFIAEQ